MSKQSSSFSFGKSLWELWCVASIIGIWPRHIEPRLLYTTRLSLPIASLPSALEGLKIAQISDLHLNEKISNAFLNKIIRKTASFKPDLILFTGDFICTSILSQPERLKSFLNSFSAPLGCFACLGNHDYAGYVSINNQGEYDLIDPHFSHLRKGWRRLFSKIHLNGKVSEKASSVAMHQPLLKLLEETPFKLLHNETVQVGQTLNVTGLGEYVLGQCLPKKAFENFDATYPGIILAHNPDAIPTLSHCPGQVIFSGHSHGGQINLPYLKGKFSLLENPQYMRGLHRVGNKWAYINRGLSSGMYFRWFSPPELLCMTLKQQS